MQVESLQIDRFFIGHFIKIFSVHPDAKRQQNRHVLIHGSAVFFLRQNVDIKGIYQITFLLHVTPRFLA